MSRWNLIWVVVALGPRLTGCPDDPRNDCGPDGCGTDGDADVDADGDVVTFDWPEPDPEATRECRVDDDCLLVVNYNLCCPCPEAVNVTWRRNSVCLVSLGSAGGRPEGCGLGCTHDELCPTCPEATGTTCGGEQCRTLYPGACHPEAPTSCAAGTVCELIDGVATCVDDPSLCATDDDCEVSGWVCRDWRADGVRFCWSGESTCFDDRSCPDNNYCEESDRDGVFACVDVAPLCRVGVPDDCPGDEVCVDDDHDGRGSCEAP